MADEHTITYAHRRKAGGSHDSICLACLATISSRSTEDALAREEEDHVCKFSFLARRSSYRDRTDPPA